MGKLITPFKKNHFFGYYDKSPLNVSKSFLLSHNVENKGESIKKNHSAKICVTDLMNNEIKTISSTYAWNFQQGSQLQWISEDKFIFNFFKKNYESHIFDTKTFKLNKILVNPIYSISDDKKIYSSVDYSRLNKLREGYGYYQKEYQENENLLRICSIENSDVLIELNKSDFQDFKDLNFNSCWIDHILFAPNSYDFVFLLRSITNFNNFLSYLFYYDFKNKKIINVLDTGTAGHGSWLNENNFIIWGRNKKFTKKLNNIDNYFIRKLITLFKKIGVPSIVRKEIYGDKYIQFNKIENKISELNLNIPMEISGGHFSFIEESNIMISDTYHDKNNESTLFSYNLDNKLLKIINKFWCIPNIKNKSYRCDLHPRIISKNETIIDSTHEGFRGMYLVKFDI